MTSWHFCCLAYCLYSEQKQAYCLGLPVQLPRSRVICCDFTYYFCPTFTLPLRQNTPKKRPLVITTESGFAKPACRVPWPKRDMTKSQHRIARGCDFASRFRVFFPSLSPLTQYCFCGTGTSKLSTASDDQVGLGRRFEAFRKGDTGTKRKKTIS